MTSKTKENARTSIVIGVILLLIGIGILSNICYNLYYDGGLSAETARQTKEIADTFSGSKHPAKKDTVVSLETTKECMRAAADYQISVIVPEDEIRRREKRGYSWLGHNVGGWRSGTFHLGLFKLWELTKDPKYMDQMMAVGNLRKLNRIPG